MATIQELIEQWKKEAAQSQTVTGKEIPNIAMYQQQNNIHRDYGANNSALAREAANQQMLSQPAPVQPTVVNGVQQLPELEQMAQRLPSQTVDLKAQMKQQLYNQAAWEADKAQMDTWLNPNYKMSKGEEIAAQQMALDGLKKFRGRLISSLTPEEKEQLAYYKDLQTKTSEVQSFAIGAAEQAVKLARGARKLGDLGFMGPVTQLSNKLTAPITDKILDRYDQTENVRQMVGTQNPLATGAGRFATNAAAYAVTNPAFDSLAGATGATGLGKFALNQAAQGAQDIALDIVPTYEEMTKDGPITDAEIQQLAKQFGWDMVGNLALGVGGELIKKVKAAKDASNVTRAANEAFAEGISKRADELAALNEQGYVPPQRLTTDEIASLNTNPVEANNKQFGELMDEFNRQFKDESAMRNIFTPEDLEAAQKAQFDELMKGRPKTIADLAPDEIPEINTELPEIPSLKDIDDYTNMWGNSEIKSLSEEAKPAKSANEIPEIAENVPKTDSKKDFGYIDLPEEVAEKGASDFQEIWDSVDAMRKVAEASGDQKVLDKFNKLSKAVNDYENAFFKNESEDALISAKKATDAARQGFIREVKKTNPNYVGDLTGTKLGNAAYRRTSMKANEQATQELVDSIIQTEKELGENNRWVKDAVPETQNPLRGVNPSVENAAESLSKEMDSDDLVMAEDIGLNPKTDIEEPKFKIEEIDEAQAPKSGESITDSTKVNERGQSRHIRNADTPMKMEDVSDEVVADFEKDPDMYAVLKNKDTKAKAENIYNTSDNPEADFREMLSRKDPAALPLGHQLAKDYSAAGNHSAAAQIYRDMGEALTQSGQFSQAAVINMVKNDPLTALDYAQKELNKLNDIGRQRFKGKWTDFELTPDEINAFKKIQPGDADGIKDIYDLIGTRLGKEYPTTFWDKVIEARRVAMLFNPRTNVRNVLANPPTLAMRWASDRVEAVGQNIAHLIDPNIKVTQSIYGSGTKGRKLAKEIYNGDQVQAMLKGSGSKSELPELKNSVMTRKQVFKGTPVSKFIDKMTNGGIQKANEKLFGVKGVQSLAETLRNATYKALDLGDKPFVKENFVERLGSYIAAQGYKSASEVPEEAIMTAWEEAMKATYKDNSWAVDMLRGFKKGLEKGDNIIPGLGTAMSQSAIPFVQAPGNIAARMVDYSPVGAIKGLGNIVSGAKNGSAKAIEKGIEEVSKGLTGTGLIVLGMKLRESGVLTGTYSENKRQKAFQKQNGFKEFAIHAGDGYFTYGWAQPFAEELMVGTLLQDAIEKSDEYDSDILKYFGIEGSNAGKAIGVAKEGTRAAVNSWFNESPISGLADFFKGNSYSDTDIAGNIWENGVEDFAGSLVPAAVNATAKSLDPVQRNTLDSTNKFASFVNSNVAKLPVLSESLPAKYDTWGNEMRYAKTKAGAAATKFLLPGDYGYDKNDNTDNEINRLFEETGNNNVFPPEAEKTIGDKKLDNWGVSTYQEDMGKRNRQLAESFIKSDLYKNLPDEERAEILSNLYGASKTITKRDKFDSAVPDSSSYKKAIAAYDEAGGGQKGVDAMINFYAGKKIISDTGISDSSNAAKEIQEAALSGDMKKAEKLADNAAKTKEILDKYDISTSSNAGKDIKAAIEAGKPREAEMIAKKAKAEKEEQTKAEETKDTLSSYGLDKTGPTKTYEKAKSEIPGLTTQQFATTYKKIDSDGNQGIKQDEIIDYLNNNNVTEAEAQKIWSAYGNSSWKKIPVLKNGKWTKGNK